MNYFEYKGIRSCDLGLRIQEKEVFSGPQYELNFDEIPGRDGDVIRSGGRFPNVQVTYSVFLPAKTISELSAKIMAVKAWLYSDLDQYHELLDTYNPNFTRKAVFSGKLDIEDELNRIGVFTISFSCRPFQYSVGGTVQECVTGDTIFNPYPFASKPYIKVYGKGPGSMTIQAASHNESWSFESIDGYLEIDSEQMNFYKGTEPKNDTVTGTGFPALYPGDNAITLSGGITKIEIEPRWMTI
jgi:phage-related protein